MATKERAGGTAASVPTPGHRQSVPTGLHGHGRGGGGIPPGGCAVGGRRSLGSIPPFGVAAVAAAGSGISGFCTLAGACLGYLCLEGMTDGMRYAASAILTYSVAFAFL